ncbi:MAG: hypothetical protein SV765_04625 [Pseudomonadota bacterium]|nr:hypothetical protein [Pseudomonadales bacterium]MDY6919480.1 hypothetical protein [Pseudomonadota bacterium]
MDDQFWLGLAAAAAVVLILSVAWLGRQVMLLQRRQRGLLAERQSLENRLRTLENKVEFLNTGTLGMGQRLMQAEKRLNQAWERQDSLTQNNAEQLFRRQADRVLQGRPLPATEEETPSRSEAKLMALVGGARKQSD